MVGRDAGRREEECARVCGRAVPRGGSAGVECEECAETRTKTKTSAVRRRTALVGDAHAVRQLLPRARHELLQKDRSARGNMARQLDREDGVGAGAGCGPKAGVGTGTAEGSVM